MMMQPLTSGTDTAGGTTLKTLQVFLLSVQKITSKSILNTYIIVQWWISIQASSWKS